MLEEQLQAYGYVINHYSGHAPPVMWASLRARCANGCQGGGHSLPELARKSRALLFAFLFRLSVCRIGTMQAVINPHFEHKTITPLVAAHCVDFECKVQELRWSHREFQIRCS